MKNIRAIRFYVTIAALLITIVWSGICISKVILIDNDSNHEKAVDGNLIDNESLYKGYQQRKSYQSHSTAIIASIVSSAGSSSSSNSISNSW